MTPVEFQRAMREECKGTDLVTVRANGLRHIKQALGDYADLYIDAVGDWFERMQELANRKPDFGPPTTATIGRADETQGAAPL